jgi:mevalonate kinase
MRAFAEAPAKAIITGEHFVVHGSWALAAALPRKIRVEIRPSSKFEVSSDKFAGGSPALRPVGTIIGNMARAFSVSPSVEVSMVSSIPDGAGLGSSAAASVAVASAFSRLNSLGLGVEEIVRYAMVGEKEIHGNPSGIDPTTCAHGGVILFRPGHPPRKINPKGGRSLVISYSGMRRRTKGLIGRVALTRDGNRDLFAALATSVGWLSRSASEMLSEGDLRGLGRLLRLNHAVLRAMGVSNRVVDDMIDTLTSMGSYGAKLTGAGGGGSVIAVCPKAKEKSIVSGLSARGFETFRAEIPVGGVKSWLER